jgi:DNA-binding NarL/FixJ family response regulator
MRVADSIGDTEMSLKIHEDIINVLIAGEDLIARLGLRTLLQVSGKVAIVGETDGGRDTAAEIERLSPHVVLLHAHVSGAQFLNELRDLTRRAPVLLLANDESPAAVERALRVGATGYLINGQYGPDELIAAVLATAQGQPRLSPAAIRVLVHRLRTIRGPREPARSPQLSKREIEIVNHLVRGGTNAEIARSLGISEKTVKNHVNHIYAKLHTRNRAETVALWLGPDSPHVSGNEPPSQDRHERGSPRP